ncbi:MAG: metalloregulator ArsR/SmtB family transcription factor [Gammaproteobacteria bacterium]|nr:metalloregulator ArsR/SmtB family transcription factor [Gammaproteobacteria bacterium]MDX2459813.1 metalloregulator ArsR/SmtB family transcription factor [Gammaproteobacteria bacterium]
METLLNGLRAAGEPTRLRLLALLCRNELTVSELTRILGQSQPRVSRHLKLLSDARLVERIQEGSWAFYRLADRGPATDILASLVALLPQDDPELKRDYQRLEAVKQDRAAAASAYFRDIAKNWDRIRDLYVAESDVEQAMLAAAGQGPIDTLLDLGTGTGRILQVFGARVSRGLGIDASREMLSVARANLAKQDLNHCQVRHGDIYNLSVPAGSVDVITIHHVLHFLDDPATAIAEAAQALRPRGRLLVVDFAPHGLEVLRSDYAHRRLGFDDGEITAWCLAAGLEDMRIKHLAVSGPSDAEKLTVSLWTGVQRADAPAHYQLDVA